MRDEFHFAVLGAEGVGKSCLVIRFIQGHFVEDYDPTIEDSYRKQIQLPNYHDEITKDSPSVLLDILDTAYLEYASMRDRYLRSTQGIAVVYSITSLSSFEEVDSIVEQAHRVKDWDIDQKNIPIVIVASKMDLEADRQVPVSAGRDYAAKRGYLYIETSAKNGENVDNLFYDLTKRAIIFQNDIDGGYYRTTGRTKSNKRQKAKRGLFSSKSHAPKEVNPHENVKVLSTRLYGHDATKLPPPVVIPESTYAQNMKELKNDTDFADIFFVTKDSPELIPAHKFIMIARCGKMRQTIEHHDKNGDKSSGLAVPYSEATFKLFLEFAYENSLTLPNPEREVPELLNLAKEWNMVDLVSMIAEKHPTLVPASDIPASTSDINPIPKYKRDIRRSLIASGSDYKSFDVKFTIKDEPGKYIFAHKAILSHRSPYFRAMFTGGTKEKTAFEIEMSEFAHLPLLSSIEYCYTDDVRFIDDVIAADLLIAANKLCLGRLKSKVSEYIASGMHWDNLIKMYKLAIFADAESLREYCSFYIGRTYNKLHKSHPDFNLLTNEEQAFFTDSRIKWTDIDDLEESWYKKLMEKDEENEKEKVKEKTTEKQEAVNSKGCGIM